MGAQINVLDKTQSPTKILFMLAWPTIIEQLLLTLVSYVDSGMVGRLGVEATAAVAVGVNYVWLINGLVMGIGVGFSVMVASSIGEGNIEKAKETIRQAVISMFVFGAFLVIVTEVIVAPNIASWMGADEGIHEDIASYVYIVGYALFFQVFLAVSGAIIRSTGNARTPMVYNVANNILNIVFNYFLIYPTRQISLGSLDIQMFGMGLGIKGAALGTAFAAIISGTLMLLTLFLGKSTVKISFKDKFHFKKSIIWAMIALAIPVAFERTVQQGGQMIGTVLVTGLGNVPLAAHQLANIAESICFLPPYAFSIASMTLIAQSLGAKDKSLAKTYASLSIKYGMIIMIISSAMLFLFSPQLMGLLIKDAAVISLGAMVLRIQAITEPCLGFTNIVSGIIKGAGDTKTPFYISLIGMWLVRTLPAIVLIKVFNMGLLGLWIPMAIDWLCRALIYYCYKLRKDRWLE